MASFPFSLSTPSSLRPGKLENSWTNVVGNPQRNKTSCGLGYGGGGTLQTDVVWFLFEAGKSTSAQQLGSKAIFKSNTTARLAALCWASGNHPLMGAQLKGSCSNASLPSRSPTLLPTLCLPPRWAGSKMEEARQDQPVRPFCFSPLSRQQ